MPTYNFIIGKSIDYSSLSILPVMDRLFLVVSATSNHGAMKTSMYISSHLCLRASLGDLPGSWISRPQGCVASTLPAIAKCSAKWVTWACSHKRCLTMLLLRHLGGSFVSLNSSKTRRSNGNDCSVPLWFVSVFVLRLLFFNLLLDNDQNGTFSHVSWPFVSLSWELLVSVLNPFLWVVHAQVLTWENLLRIPDTASLSVMHPACTFFHDF